MFKYFFASITRNALSLAGTALALASLVLIISLVVIQLLGYEGGPYLGIVTFLVLPGLAIIGLILIPIGGLMWRAKMRKMPEGQDLPMFPVFDLNQGKTRKWTLIFVGITILNVVILSGATYSGIHHMESVEFCGLACHSVMEPEFTAHAVHGPRSGPPLAGFLCRLPHWPGRRLVRQVETGWRMAAGFRQPRAVSEADSNATPRSAPGS
jgi:hypothetical protein